MTEMDVLYIPSSFHYHIFIVICSLSSFHHHLFITIFSLSSFLTLIKVSYIYPRGQTQHHPSPPLYCPQHFFPFTLPLSKLFFIVLRTVLSTVCFTFSLPFAALFFTSPIPFSALFLTSSLPFSAVFLPPLYRFQQYFYLLYRFQHCSLSPLYHTQHCSLPSLYYTQPPPITSPLPPG